MGKSIWFLITHKFDSIYNDDSFNFDKLLGISRRFFISKLIFHYLSEFWHSKNILLLNVQNEHNFVDILFYPVLFCIRSLYESRRENDQFILSWKRHITFLRKISFIVAFQRNVENSHTEENSFSKISPFCDLYSWGGSIILVKGREPGQSSNQSNRSSLGSDTRTLKHDLHEEICEVRV